MMKFSAVCSWKIPFGKRIRDVQDHAMHRNMDNGVVAAAKLVSDWNGTVACYGTGHDSLKYSTTV